MNLQQTGLLLFLLSIYILKGRNDFKLYRLAFKYNQSTIPRDDEKRSNSRGVKHMVHRNSLSGPHDNCALSSLTFQQSCFCQGRRQGMLQRKREAKRGERGKYCWGIGRAHYVGHPFSSTTPSEVALHRPPLSGWAVKENLSRNRTAEWVTCMITRLPHILKNMIQICTFSFLSFAANELLGENKKNSGHPLLMMSLAA